MLSQEKAVEEIAAIYKLAGLSGCFIYGDIKSSKNPAIHLIDPTTATEDTHQITVFSLAMISPLYRGIMCMLSMVGMGLEEMTPITGDGYQSSIDYHRDCLAALRNGSIGKFYNEKIKNNNKIPQASKEIMLKLLEPLTNI